MEGEATASTLDDPFGLLLLEEEEEDEGLREIPMPEDDEDDDETALANTEEVDEEEPQPKFKLFIADRGNSRVLIWDELPYPKEEEKADDEFEELHGDRQFADDASLVGGCSPSTCLP